MPRRRSWFHFDLFSALERLRFQLASLFTRRPHEGRPSRWADDAKRRKTTPEVLALEWRNPPTEAIGRGAVLPLALVAAEASAATYYVGPELAAEAARPGPLVEGNARKPEPERGGGGGGGGGAGAEAGGGEQADARAGGVTLWSRSDPFALSDDFGSVGSVILWAGFATSGLERASGGGGGGG